MIDISVIVTTYNWPKALSLVLQSLNQQTIGDFEVLVADDGSTEQTVALIKSLQTQVNYPLHHVWQEDVGFRAAKIRNQAVAKASGDYLVFVDGDCVVREDFIAKHKRLKEKDWLVVGNRVLLNAKFTNKVLLEELQLAGQDFAYWLAQRKVGHCNRVWPLLSLPLGVIRKLKPLCWRGAKTCNLAMWKEDFIAVNGLDEAYEGWGYEDSDLVIRLQHYGVKRKSGEFSIPVLHLYHKLTDQSKQGLNLVRLNSLIASQKIRAEKGVDQYLV